ncbi:MAG: T9SS type A sorting domain-containing protein [Candidatus Marinimicrobia bacterium]|nr:T9SS type A sorting domain-containing protein [Candidatus Neomarinimicrobiota bacterium]
MKYFPFGLSTLLSMSSLVHAQPDTLWTRTYGGAANDHGEAIQLTSDGGYIITGDATPLGSDNRDVWLIKTDALGQQEWSHMFGGSGDDKGFSVQPTLDGGYIVTAATNSFGSGDYDFWLIKTDSLGQEQWNQTFGGESPDYARSVKGTIGGGYILTGRTASFGSGGDDIWVVKTDSNGDEEWNETFGGSEHEAGYSILQASDRGYIIAGRTSSFGNGDDDVWLIKTDSLGQEEWSQTYGGGNWESAFSIQETTSGGYIVVGGTNSFGNGDDDVWLIKTDSLGQEEWSQTYGGSNWETGFSVQENVDGGYIITGGTTSFGNGDRDVWIIKTDSLGQEEWSQTYGGGMYDIGSCIRQTVEGGYVVVGSTLSFGSGGWDALLICLGPERLPYDGPVWHVSTNGSDSTGTGSLDNPFESIQNGIDNSLNGDTVLVQPGTYVENINFNGKDVVVSSLFLTSENTSFISGTVIDGDSSATVVTFNSGEDSTALLIGLTITNGRNNMGGGILVQNSNPKISFCNIEGNKAEYHGGGLYFEKARVTISNSMINNNKIELSEDTSGGGIYAYDSSYININDCKVIGNEAYSGGGLFTRESFLSIEGSQISNNTVGLDGGGLCLISSHASIRNTEIKHNSSSYSGGGIHSRSGVEGTHYFIELDRVLIAHNICGEYGGGIHSEFNNTVIVKNSTIAHNSSSYSGGIYFRHGTNIILLNSIVYNNSNFQIEGMFGGVATTLGVANCDIQGGLDDGINTSGSTTEIFYANSIDGEPTFIDTANGDFGLLEGSPCIDTGTSLFTWEEDTLINMDSNEYNGIAPDMGAYESEEIVNAEEILFPNEYKLQQNYPNPFNPSTTMMYELPEQVEVSLTVYDIAGRTIATLVNQTMQAGQYETHWNGTDESGKQVASGMYFVRLQAGIHSSVVKMVYLK